jgi:hypothetical protein
VSGWGRGLTGTGTKVIGQGYDFSGPSASGQSQAGGIYHPGTGAHMAGEASQIDAAQVGRVSVNLFQPDKSAEEAASGIGGFFNGWRQQLFGGNEQDEYGEASRQNSLLGGAPIVGDLGRGASDLLGGAGEVFGGITGGIGGALERIPGGTPADNDAINAQFASPAMQAWLDRPNNENPEVTNRQAYQGDKGLGDSGFLSNEGHYKSAAVRAFKQFEAIQNPTFQPGAFTAPLSLADQVTNAFDGLGTIGSAWSRFLAGVKNRAGEVQAMGDEGKPVYDENGKLLGYSGGVADMGIFGLTGSGEKMELSAVEQVAYQKMEDGTWTPDQATDFLVTNGFTAHDAGLSIALSVASPDLVLGFGAAGFAKLGVKGAELAATVDKAGVALKAADTALDAARAGLAAAKPGSKAAKAAQKVLDAAIGEQDEAAKAVKALETYHSSAGGFRKANVLARGVEDSKVAQDLVLLFGRTYSGMAGTSLGKAAKVARYLIDPLHGIDLKMPSASRAVDLTSDVLPRTVADTMGVHHYKGVLDDLLKLDNTGVTASRFAEDYGTAAANFGRQQLIDQFVATQMHAGLGEELVGKGIDELFDMAVQSTKEKDLVRYLREGTVKTIIQRTWTQPDIQATARALNKAYPERTAELWEEFIKRSSVEVRSNLKFAAYGRLNKALLDWSADAATKGIKVGANQLDPGRMVLLAKGTFTRIAADDLLAKLAKTKSAKKKVELIREYQERYKSLRYVSVDPANAGKSVDNFVEWLSDGLDRLPMQATNDELDALDGIDDIRDVLGDGYSLGFRPADEYLHGIERANGTGLYTRSGSTWVDHVADGAISYRPARYLDLNILGKPIPAIPGLRVGAKLVDHMDSAARIAKAQVSGAMVTEAAKGKFIAESQAKFAEHGVNEALATQWWEAIQKATRKANEGAASVSGPRGMSNKGLYDALKDTSLIPQPLLNGSRRLTPADVLKLVLNAYEGDMRYVGLTQKLSGRVKNMLSLDGHINYAGQIAEAVWPTLKFRYNPIFQLQEKVEPWVLNAQRGVSFATGANLSKEDEVLEALLQRMTESSLVRQADLDQFEYSSRVLYGKGIEKTAMEPGSRINRISNATAGRLFGDIQGMKRVNMLRTFKKGLGKEVKAAWEQANPGAWDDMKLDANVRSGRVLSDDDFALSLMSQHALANDIAVTRLKGVLGKEGLTADWSNAIKTGAWSTPATLGELKALDLEHMAASLQFVRKSGIKYGEPVEDLNALRESLALGEVTLDDVAEALNVMGADPDYIKRVQNALDFNWNGFWKQATKRFNLTPEESRALQDMMAGAGRVRGMTPVDFMSQVFSPYITDGAEGVLGHLDGHVTILRQAREAGRKMKAKEAKVKESRTVLAATEGSAREDLVRQLSRTFSAHLDPSAKRALLLEFRPELKKLMREQGVVDMSSVKGLWNDDMDTMLADRIIGYMDGIQPTHPFDDIVDDALGVADVRKGAQTYMESRGVKPHEQRRYFKPDEVLSEDTAKAYSALPTVKYEKTGRKPTIRQIEKSSTELKPRPDDVDERTYAAYQDMVVETRAQWDHMTKPKSEGGMGIKVIIARGDPYPNSAAMRADVAKGRIRVFADSSDHPLMTNEQNVMFRAVHDVFGHAAEGFEFGPRGELNAAIKHSQMYSDTGRAAMLTETHGQNSWVNFSDDVIEDTPQAPLPNTVDEYEAEFPYELPDAYKQPAKGEPGYDPDAPPQDDFYLDIHGESNYGTTDLLQLTVQERVGNGIRALPAEQQAFILNRMAKLQRRYPDFKVYHVDVPENFHVPTDEGGMGMVPSTNGVTWGADDAEAVILLSPDNYHEEFATASQRAIAGNVSFASKKTKKLPDGTEVPRESDYGVPWAAGGGGTEHTIYHEVGHAIDSKLRPEYAWMGHTGPTRLPENEAYFDFMEAFDKSPARRQLSEYAFNETQDSAAELFALSNRIADDPDFDLTILEPELAQAVQDYTKLLKDLGHWVDDTPNPNAGKRVRDVNKATPGAVYAEQKAALLPQDILDRFGSQYVGRGKHVESNPDVARTAQYFGKWTDAVVNNGLLKGDAAQYRGILDDIAGLPTQAATAYNHTEAMALNLATNSMVRKWDDAFRLQYFAQERTMLERTINHPMFGLYPASYMWGKIAPELVRFIANEPFGIKTGGLLYGAMDAQAAIALRREYDPEFDYAIENLGHSQALSFLGFLLPSLPWDVGASAPAWMRDVAQQGLSAEKAIAEGEEPAGFSPLNAVKESGEQAMPYFRQAAWAQRAIGEVFPGEQTEEQVDEAQAKEDEFVQAAELEGPLSEVMAELRAVLSR